jgi:hypothetical protein
VDQVFGATARLLFHWEEHWFGSMPVVCDTCRIAHARCMLQVIRAKMSKRCRAHDKIKKLRKHALAQVKQVEASKG